MRTHFFKSLAKKTIAFGYISSTRANSGGSNIVVSVPSETPDGVLMIAVLNHNSSGLSITPPAGWTQRFFDSVSTNSVAIFSKIASSEPASYTWTWSGSANNTASILTYGGVTEVNTVGAIARATGTVVTAPSITPTASGILLGISSIEGSSNTFVGVVPAMTQRSLYSPNAPRQVVVDSAQEATSTGSRDFSWSTSNTANAILLQLS